VSRGFFTQYLGFGWEVFSAGGGRIWGSIRSDIDSCDFLNRLPKLCHKGSRRVRGLDELMRELGKEKGQKKGDFGRGDGEKR
jgi:hypothetical protein